MVPPALTQMLGNPSARVLLISPPAGEVGYEENLPLVGRAERAFVEILEAHRLALEENFLCVSCSRWGVKPSKASCEPVREFVEACGKEKLFPLYVCLGGVAFSHIFGGGKKPSMRTLAGSTLHLRELPGARLFVFNDPDPLAPEYSNRPQDRREDAFRARCQEDAQVQFDRHCLILKGLL